MSEQVARAILFAAYSYLSAGVIAAFIITLGLSRIDSEAKGAGLAFRAIIFPGIVALWPMLLKRYLRGSGEAPVQEDPHR